MTAHRDLDHLPFCSPPMPFAGCRFLSPHVSCWKRTSRWRFKDFLPRETSGGGGRSKSAIAADAQCHDVPQDKVEYASDCVVMHTDDDPHCAMSTALCVFCTLLHSHQ